MTRLSPHRQLADLAEEALRHGHQRLFRPLVEPVDVGAVDERRELPGPGGDNRQRHQHDDTSRLTESLLSVFYLLEVLNAVGR